MIKENIAQKSFKFLFKEIIFDVFYWPIWWYTGGVKKAWMRFGDSIVNGNRNLGLSVWIKNIFKPMFGQYDWQGRLISFFVRLAQIIVRSIGLVFWIIFSLIIFFVWLILPLFLILQFLFNLGIFGADIWTI